MNTLKTGRTYGFAFGMIGIITGLIILTTLFNSGLRFLDQETLFSAIVVLLVFSIFSIYFGGRAATRIVHRGENAYFEGGISSILTICATVIISVPLVGFLQGTSFEMGIESILEMIFVYLIYCVFLGGIPAILIGTIFGAFIKRKCDKNV